MSPRTRRKLVAFVSGFVFGAAVGGPVGVLLGLVAWIWLSG